MKPHAHKSNICEYRIILIIEKQNKINMSINYTIDSGKRGKYYYCTLKYFVAYLFFGKNLNITCTNMTK